jgi:hypothetical protein
VGRRIETPLPFRDLLVEMAHSVSGRMSLCAECGHAWGDHARPPHVDADVDDGKRWCFALTDDGECRCLNYEEPPSADAVDPHASSTGKLSTRDKEIDRALQIVEGEKP